MDRDLDRDSFYELSVGFGVILMMMAMAHHLKIGKLICTMANAWRPAMPPAAPLAHEEKSRAAAAGVWYHFKCPGSGQIILAHPVLELYQINLGTGQKPTPSTVTRSSAPVASTEQLFKSKAFPCR